MQKAIERMCMAISVVDDDAGKAMAVGKQTGMQPRGDDEVVARIDLVQVLIERGENDGNIFTAQQLQKMKIFGLMMRDDFHSVILREHTQRGDGKVVLTARAAVT